MKKIFLVLLCVLMIAAVPTVAFAEETVAEDTVTEDTTTEAEMTITERVVAYVKENAEGILAVIASIGSAILVKLITSKISNSVTTLNNNSIEIAKNSDESLKTTAKENKAYAAKIQELLDKYEKSEEEKKLYAEALVKAETFLKTAKLATVELSNMLAELLVLSNIPNSKKENLYARHMHMLDDLDAAERVIADDGEKA